MNKHGAHNYVRDTGQVHHTLNVELHVAVQGLHFGTLCVQWLDVLGVSNALSLIHYYIRNAEHVQLLMGFSGVPHYSLTNQTYVACGSVST